MRSGRWKEAGLESWPDSMSAGIVQATCANGTCTKQYSVASEAIFGLTALVSIRTKKTTVHTYVFDPGN